MNYKKTDFIIVPFILIHFLFSCDNFQSNDSVQKHNTEKILFPLEPDKDLQKFKDVKRTKIVAYLNGSCLPCLEDLVNWNIFLKNIPSRNHSELIKIFIYSTNPDFLKHVITKETEFSLDLIYFDKSNSFFILNILSNDKNYHAFLLDSQNNVILKGNPITNDKIKEMYFHKIKQ